MFLFPLLMVEKKHQTMLSKIRKELEMNQKITTVNNLSYFIKEELKYYEYITHIIIDLEFIEEKGDEFLTSLKALVMATDVPIIIYAEGVYPGDMLLSEIARQGLANIIGETPTTLKQISRNKMQKDLREALIKSTADRRIGLREDLTLHISRYRKAITMQYRITTTATCIYQSVYSEQCVVSVLQHTQYSLQSISLQEEQR